MGRERGGVTVIAGQTWRWSVEGRQEYSGTVERTYADGGEVTAESAGEVLDWLANGPGTPIWDALDPDYPFTITISPGAEVVPGTWSLHS